MCHAYVLLSQKILAVVVRLTQIHSEASVWNRSEGRNHKRARRRQSAAKYLLWLPSRVQKLTCKPTPSAGFMPIPKHWIIVNKATVQLERLNERLVQSANTDSRAHAVVGVVLQIVICN